ncbi:MAG TPA: ABC transporter permease [Vicinamibacterales bacterium]|nr:ABC transporter permease [Vicinamibacterales bacterium]
MGDLRDALRFLWAHKSFTATAVLTLAVGLGANAALFGLVNAILKPLPVPDAGRIVSIAADTRGDESGGFQYAFSIDAMEDLQKRAASFTDVFAAMIRFGGLASDRKPAQFFFAAVSNNYFTALRVQPHLGALFTGPSGAPASVVLGHSFWMKYFGGDPSVIGRPVRVDGRPAVVTGIVPKSFLGTFMGLEIDGYLTLDDLKVVDPDVERWLYRNRRARPLFVYGRLKPGVSVSEADAEMKGLMETLGVEHAETDAGVTARVVPEPLARPLPMRTVADAIPVVRLFSLAIAALVLLLACMNVVNLLLVRATARQREMAVRAALGASRARLARQTIAEGLVLSCLGGLAGLVVGQWVTGVFVSRFDIGADLPFAIDVGFDWRVFLYSLAAALLTGAAMGLWPAWRASRADARAALHDGGKSGSDSVDRQRLRRLLVVGQIAGSLALLVVAGLFVGSLTSAQRIDLGFDAAHLITMRLDPRQVAYDEARTNTFYKDLIDRVAAWPDVASASVAFNVPMTYLVGGGSIFIEGQPVDDSQPPATFLNRVGHGYFETMQIPIVRGRAFTEDDEQVTAKTRRIAIVNETMAKRFWPGQNPIGKRFRVYSATEPLLEVVGVARDSKYVLIFEQPRPFFYLPMERDVSMRTLHVRAKGDPRFLATRLEREVAALEPDLPIADLRTMEQSLAGVFGYLIFRIGAVQAGAMGIVGCVLAIVGVYGVVSFGASLRTREIGIRMALGAQPREVLQLILGQGVRLVIVGLAVGLTAAVGLGRVIAGFLPLVDAADYTIFAAIALALGALAVIACYLPARRATRVSAMVALRHE